MSGNCEDNNSLIPFETVAHTADLEIRVRGRDLPGLFVNAARALFAVMGQPPVSTNIERTVDVTSMDLEALLVDWLNELIFLHETEEETYNCFTITEFTPTRLSAKVSGGTTIEKTLVVKAATFHNLRIYETADGVEASVVFDV